MKRLLLLVFIILYVSAWSQSNFNTKSHLALDIAYFPYRYGTNFFSSEFQVKGRKQYLFAGFNMGNHFHIEDESNYQYGFKVGYGIYPYKNAKRLKWHHRINYFFELDSRYKDWRGNYLGLGNGAEYWIADKFTLGLNVNMYWGQVGLRGEMFIFQPLLTAKYIFKER